MASTGDTWRLGHRPALFVVAVVVALTALVVALLSRGPAPVKDPYLWFADLDIEGESKVVMIDGLPRVKYDYAGIHTPQVNPVEIAQYGLERWSKGDEASALRAADWLVKHQRTDGTWAYTFDIHVDNAGETIHAPWISAMSQGQAMSLLTRAWKLTGERIYVTTAKAALAAFSVPVERGGVLRRWQGHPFYEEYPIPGQPSLVLNGFLFSIIGLRDLAVATDDATAWRLWRAGEATAAALAPEYSIGAHDSAYSLAFRAGGPPPRLTRTTSVYAQIHVDLAREMYRLTGRPVWNRLATRWAGALPTPIYLQPLFIVEVVLALILLAALAGVRRRRLAAAAGQRGASGEDALRSLDEVPA